MNIIRRTRAAPRAGAIALTLALASVSGCSDIEEAIDCADICNRYADCYDIDYDTGACASRCRANADDDRDFADAANACETCLDDRSCTGSFVYTEECRGVVP
jgi:hypothetical protein